MARIRASAKEPVCVVFAVDRSGSMGRKVKGNPHSTLSEVAVRVVNERIRDLALQSMKERSTFRHYFDIGIFGYGFNPASGAVSAFSLLPGQLGELGICNLPALAESPLRVHSRGAVNWCQRTAGSGGSQGFPASASRMASSAVMPWAAAESR
jgi:hypothetical protein